MRDRGSEIRSAGVDLVGSVDLARGLEGGSFGFRLCWGLKLRVSVYRGTSLIRNGQRVSFYRG